MRRLRTRNQELRRRLGAWRVAAIALSVALAAVAAYAVQAESEPGAAEQVARVPLGTGIAAVGEVPPRIAAEGTPARRAAPRTAAETPADDGQPAGEGEASYYHSSLEGRPTASGEAYRGSSLTAAHRTLPLGSRVRVTHLGNGKSVVVRINDRGPFHGRRSIDLSRAAASRLDMLDRGRARVRLELLR
ncbi:MAG TPA: septal ring lytic transglycosylase RlpA family protein [Thermoanaerobaculia bacterium]|nr:septal ring lytic transglycosylase RlpA family protein [Thermoanaerobaculia bacterium]